MHLAALRPHAAARLLPDVTEGLSEGSVAALPPKVLAKLRPQSLAALRPEAMAAISPLAAAMLAPKATLTGSRAMVILYLVLVTAMLRTTSVARRSQFARRRWVMLSQRRSAGVHGSASAMALTE